MASGFRWCDGSLLVVNISDADHRTIAIQTFNSCWDILESPNAEERSAELLTAAFTSRFHWRVVGAAKEHSISDWMVSRAFVVMGQNELALMFAQSALELLSDDSELWQLASAHEGLARAYQGLGMPEKVAEHAQLAQAFLESEPNQDDAQHIASQLADLL